jgi:hypothetical protein
MNNKKYEGILMQKIYAERARIETPCVFYS